MNSEVQKSDLREPLEESTQNKSVRPEEQPSAKHERFDAEEDPLELLRTLLLDHYRQRLHGLEKEANEARQKLHLLEHRLEDTDALMETITPVIASSIQSKIRESPHEMVDALSPIIADAVRTSIAESREAMVEALYPITGQLVQRSVTEAMRDLARRIDDQMRTTFNLSTLWLRLRAILGVAPSSESVLRDLLPFEVEQIFLIHRQTGILLQHAAKSAVTENEPEQTLSPDNQLVGSMLTAIRDFVDDVLGKDEQAQLREVQYGDRLILLEAARYCYLAVVIQGVEASGYRAQMRGTVFAIEDEFLRALREFSGDTRLFSTSKERLMQLYVTVNE